MPVTTPAIDQLRERLPQFLNRGLRQLQKLPKLPLPRPGWPLGSAVAGGLSWRTAAAAALLGGIVHICATFAASFSATGEAYRLIADKLPFNSMAVLPLQAPGRQILPFLPPDMLYAICRYDLRGGPVAVRAIVPDAGWALSVHTPEGANLYVLPGQRQRSTEVSFLLKATGPEVQPIPRRETTPETQIASPTPEGLIILRAPLRGLAWTAETNAILRRATCTQLR
jgi:uncharacterized membrane protein